MRPPPENVIAVFNSRCNYRCLFCNRRLHIDQMAHWSLDDIKRLDPLWSGAKLLNIGGVGELTVLPFLPELMAYFHTRAGKICFCTNGYRLAPALARTWRLDHVAFSTHSLIPETYDYLTGTTGRLPAVLENIIAMAAAPRDYKVVFVSVLTQRNACEAVAQAEFCLRHNIDELRFLSLAAPEMVGLKEYAADVVFQESPGDLALVAKACQMMDDAGKQGTGVETGLSRPQTVAEMMHTCTAPIRQVAIDFFGNVLPCCFLQEVMGNVFRQPWEEIWNGPKYEQFRAETSAGTCALCLKHCKNWG